MYELKTVLCFTNMNVIILLDNCTLVIFSPQQYYIVLDTLVFDSVASPCLVVIQLSDQNRII